MSKFLDALTANGGNVEEAMKEVYGDSQSINLYEEAATYIINQVIDQLFESAEPVYLRRYIELLVERAQNEGIWG